MGNIESQNILIGKRLLSLDFFRGFIMVLLMLESTLFYEHLLTLTEWPIVNQFFHHPWHGLRFWDLIQPGFMFIAGAGMALSLSHQQEKGASWQQSFIKMLKRSWWLFFWGVLNYAVRPEGLSFELWNVLTQLSVTLLIAFLIFNLPITTQIIISLVLLLITELLYRYTNIPAYNLPFTNHQNFGNYADLLLMGKTNSDGWVAINFIPSACHTIWGALAGKWILNNKSQETSLKYFLIAAATCLGLGYLLDFVGMTPIIKRICTSSFIFASAGWCFLMLAICYFWIDIKNHKKYLRFFTIVGMNSIFIYLFFEIVGMRWFNEYITQIASGLGNLAHLSQHVIPILASLTIFALEWLLCYFLYKKGLFFKL